jgi:biofilm PGA synthesis N-glycosyltransferase PgaC
LDLLFLITALLITGALCTGVPLAYLLLMKNVTLRTPWNIQINDEYLPSVDVLLPTYNESGVIEKKLRNLFAQDYPSQLLHIIVVDSASIDGTFDLAKKFATSNISGTKLDVIQENSRRGKSSALNFGLELARGDVVITTDADAFWEPGAIRTLVKYFADPKIGAVTGTEGILNPSKSSATKAEVAYHSWYLYYRLGESKLHSTIITNGEMMAYRRNAIVKFDESTGSDDSGTALELVRNDLRSIQTDEAKFYDNVYYTWRGKTSVKVRRAEQLVAIWFTCLKLAILNKIKLPRRIVFFNVYLHIVNPIVLLLFGALLILTLLQEPWIILFIIAGLIYTKTRNYLVSFVSHNLFLLVGIAQYLTGKKQVVWKKVQETRESPTLATVGEVRGSVSPIAPVAGNSEKEDN